MAKIGKSKNALRFNKPASWWGSTWREALPTGNGVLGAAVYGGAGSEVIMLEHRDLWWQGHVGVLQDVADKLQSVRKKMDEDDPAAAQNILSSALIAKNYRPQMAYPLPLCDLLVDFPLDRPVRDYQRILNMDNGEVTVTYRDGATRYERSCFVSRANNTLCYEITKSGGKSIEATFSFALHDKFNARTQASGRRERKLRKLLHVFFRPFGQRHRIRLRRPYKLLRRLAVRRPYEGDHDKGCG